VLLDPKSQIARAYGATVTPHMYVIDKTGKLAYAVSTTTARPYGCTVKYALPSA